MIDPVTIWCVYRLDTEVGATSELFFRDLDDAKKAARAYYFFDQEEQCWNADPHEIDQSDYYSITSQKATLAGPSPEGYMVMAEKLYSSYKEFDSGELQGTT